MYRAMLVEDEELILRGLPYIIDWEELGVEIVYMASNGHDALTYARNNRLDLIISDINMPVMDGLSFLSSLRESDTRTRLIILSGYDEFSYAKRALQLDVEDYILKPIDEEKLYEAVKVSIDKLIKIDKEKQERVQKDSGWILYLRGKLSADEAKEYDGILHQYLDSQQSAIGIMKFQENRLGHGSLTEVLDFLRKEKEWLRPIYLNYKTLLLLLNVSDHEVDIIKRIRDIQMNIEMNYNLGSFVTMHRCRERCDIRSTYQTLTNLQKYILVYDYGSCITDETAAGSDTVKEEFSAAQLRKLILKRERTECISYIDELLECYITEGKNIEGIYELLIKITLELNALKKEFKIEESNSPLNLVSFVNLLYNVETAVEIKTILINEIIVMIEKLKEENSCYTPVVKQIMDMVESQCEKEWSLKQLSNQFHMNTSYLGQLFQKETKCSFSNYVTKIKMEKARHLIMSTNYKIAEIALAVGYVDNTYFFRKFKQYFGVSPASLRELKKY